jgi:5-methylcytosine-specific restriction enzyme A
MSSAKRIPERQYAAACSFASLVFDGKIRESEGAAALARDFGLNQTSARDYIRDYKSLMKGRVFKRSMSAEAMDHFIEQIRIERGSHSLFQALAALRLHLEYRPNALMQKVLGHFEALAAESSPLVSMPSDKSQ